jgi:hypothetical protein
MAVTRGLCCCRMDHPGAKALEVLAITTDFLGPAGAGTFPRAADSGDLSEVAGALAALIQCRQSRPYRTSALSPERAFAQIMARSNNMQVQQRTRPRPAVQPGLHAAMWLHRSGRSYRPQYFQSSDVADAEQFSNTFVDLRALSSPRNSWSSSTPFGFNVGYPVSLRAIPRHSSKCNDAAHLYYLSCGTNARSV